MKFFSRAKGPAPSATRARAASAVTARIEANPAMRRAKIDGAQIYYHPDFLNDAECDRLIALIDANRRPSTLLAASQASPRSHHASPPGEVPPSSSRRRAPPRTLDR